MELDKLQDFNEVVNFYDSIQYLVKNSKPRTELTEVIQRVMDSSILARSRLVLVRTVISNLALFLTQVQERARDMNAMQVLETKINNENILPNIHCNGQISTTEKIRQLRNCLAHSSYTLKLEAIDKEKLKNWTTTQGYKVSIDVQLLIKNNVIEGSINIGDLMELSKRFHDVFDYLQNGDDINIYKIALNNGTNQNNNETKDKSSVIKVTRKKDDSGISADKLIYRYGKIFGKSKNDLVRDGEIYKIIEGFKSFDIQEQEVSSQKEEEFRKFIDYVGKKAFIEDGELYNSFITNVFAANECHHLPINLLIGYIGIINELTLINDVIMMESFKPIDKNSFQIQSVFETDDSSQTEEILDLFSLLHGYRYISPIIYANNLLGKSYYMLNYAREINEQEGGKFFDYYDIQNLEGIIAHEEDSNGNKVEKQVQVNPLQRFKDKLAKVEEAITQLEVERNEKEKLRRTLKNPRYRKQNNSESLENINKWLNNYNSRKNQLRHDKHELEQKIQDGINKGLDRNNSFHFFRHLRNSLAHGTYEIVYGDYKNTDEIRYCFRNIDPRTRNVYVVELTASQLEKVLEGFQQKVNECDKGFLDRQKLEKDVMREAMLKMGITQTEVDEEKDFINLLDMSEKPSLEVKESK